MVGVAAQRRVGVRAWVVVLAIGLGGIGGAVSATARAADSDDLTCNGTEHVTFTPGLTNEPRATKVVIDRTFRPCSSNDKALSSGVSHDEHQATLSCSDQPHAVSGTNDIRWDNGRASTFDFTGTSQEANGSGTGSGTGKITKGEFANDSVDWVVNVSDPHPSDCSSPEGDRSDDGTVSIRIFR